MKLDHREVVLDLEGQPCVENGKPLTFRGLVFLALNHVTATETLGAEAKAKAFHTCQKLFKGRRVSLTVEEAALIKERAAIVLGPMFYGRLAEWLEGEPQDFARDEDGEDGEDGESVADAGGGPEPDGERPEGDQVGQPSPG